MSKDQAEQRPYEEVVCYKTPDGKIHETAAEAHAHWRECELKGTLRSFADIKHVHNMSSEELAELLFDNSRMLLAILECGIRAPKP